MIDNIILNNLANQNRAPYRLITKRVENKRTPKSGLNLKYSAHFESAHSRTFKSNQFCTKPAQIQSSSNSVSTNCNQHSRKIYPGDQNEMGCRNDLKS